MKDLKTWLIYGGVGLAVMLPMLMPGFILTLDMAFTPELRLPESLTASWPFHALLYVLNFVIPSDILQKILLFCILLLAGIGMHRLIRLLQPKEQEGAWGIYFASIFFMINPFVYSRFMAGQYAVLLGYALLPWFVRLLLQFIHRPELKTGLKLGALMIVIGIVSIHTLAAVTVLIAAAIGIVLWRYRSKAKTFAKFGGMALGLFLLVSSYWLVPLMLGQGQIAQTAQSFTTADTAAFETRGGNPLVQIGHVLRLQGFWAENRGQFLLPQDAITPWGLMALAIIGLVITGTVVLWRRSKMLAVFFGASVLAAIVIAVGLTPLPPGYREPHKIVALVVLGYAVFASFGVDALLAWAREKTEAAYATAAVVVLILPFLFMRVQLWGFNGQLLPRQYPTEWTSVNQRLNEDSADFSVLFLPWHQYMSFGFSGRIITNPAPTFFDKHIVASTDPELDGATSGRTDPNEIAVRNILSEAKNHTDLAEQLAARNIKYILIAKEVDYQEYHFVTTQPGIEQAADYPSLTLYRNTAWKETQ